MLMGIDAGGASSLVRVPDHRASRIGWVLDAGAAGVLVPLVNSAEDAANVVRAIRYPPNGIRSYGPQRASLRMTADPAQLESNVACIAMIETAEGLERAQEIAACSGVDALYVGPSDLAIGLGAVATPPTCLGREPNLFGRVEPSERGRQSRGKSVWNPLRGLRKCQSVPRARVHVRDDSQRRRESRKLCRICAIHSPVSSLISARSFRTEHARRPDSEKKVEQHNRTDHVPRHGLSPGEEESTRE